MPAVFSALGIVAYLALFSSVGLVFVFVNLLLGKFLRPDNPEPEKLEVYECGEPTIGSSFVQFDLRFYVVALLFIIFDVEVAFFFPWATVFGKANHLSDARLEVVSYEGELTPDALALYQELGIRDPQLSDRAPASLVSKVVARHGDASLSTPAAKATAIREGARQLILVTLVDIVVFFAVLMIGFAYVWRRGDLDWVRAVSRERGAERSNAAANEQTPVLTA